MKTIICPQHLKTALYHRLAEKNGHVTDTFIQSMSTLFHLPQTKDADLMLQSKHLLQAHAEQFPIYRAMFAYTAFIQELLAFAKTCALFGITEKQLPQRTGDEDGTISFAHTYHIELLFLNFPKVRADAQGYDIHQPLIFHASYGNRCSGKATIRISLL